MSFWRKFISKEDTSPDEIKKDIVNLTSNIAKEIGYMNDVNKLLIIKKRTEHVLEKRTPSFEWEECIFF